MNNHNLVITWLFIYRSSDATENYLKSWNTSVKPLYNVPKVLAYISDIWLQVPHCRTRYFPSTQHRSSLSQCDYGYKTIKFNVSSPEVDKWRTGLLDNFLKK